MYDSAKPQDMKDFRQYAWDYFHYHAKQRLTTFNFYIIICSILATGYFTALRDSATTGFGSIVGALLSFLSFIFWKLDIRNRQMIENVVEALKHIEADAPLDDNSGTPHILKLFLYEEAQTKRAKESNGLWPWNRHYTYGRCFNLVFLVFGILGILGCLYGAATF
ncbi:MAG: hypothetical protein JSU94_13330 [Phycisphaerales bacterium]|nr:MAG: hypothetical protein JSU94_13330 [Phycisphaerales bacterium]